MTTQEAALSWQPQHAPRCNKPSSKGIKDHSAEQHSTQQAAVACSQAVLAAPLHGLQGEIVIQQVLVQKAFTTVRTAYSYLC